MMSRQRETKGQFSHLWFALFFIVIGGLCLVAGVVNYIHEEAFFANAEEETATLIKYVPDPNYKVADFRPKFQFTTKAGQVVTYIWEERLSKPEPGQIG